MPGPSIINPDVALLTGVANRFALSLATLVVDQTLLSESDRPFEPFTAEFAVGRRATTACRLEPGCSVLRASQNERSRSR
jgi:hypothetical protein